MIDWDAMVGAPCMKVFGEDLRPTYAPPGGGVPFEFDGIFDDAYYALMLDADDGPAIATLEPVIGVRLAQFTTTPPVKGGKVTVPRLAKTYVVTSVEPDGKGAAFLRLTLAKPVP